MAEIVPFKPGVPQQSFDCVLAGVPYWIRSFWNARENAHYIDVHEANREPIATGIKVVLGTLLGQGYTHPFFAGRGLFAIDESNTGAEAGVDDLGGRVTVAYFTEVDLQLANAPPLEIPDDDR